MTDLDGIYEEASIEWEVFLSDGTRWQLWAGFDDSIEERDVLVLIHSDVSRLDLGVTKYYGHIKIGDIWMMYDKL